MSQVRIGVIGAGLIGRKHIEVLSSGQREYTLAGVADPSPAAKQEAAQQGYECYSTIDEMIDAAKPDGAVVSVPNQLHVAAGRTCVDRGIPIIVEKPVADTVADALALVEAAEAAGVPTLTGHHRRHNPIMRRAAELLRDGAIGRIVAATSIWLSHKPQGYHDLAWRREPGGGPVLINAIHEIDCLRMLCGDVETVQAADSSAVRGFAVEDTAAAILRFNSGALGTVLLSDTVSSPWAWETTSGENPQYPKTDQDSILIGGTRGSLAVPSLDVRWHEQGEESWWQPLYQRREPVIPADPYYEQMRNFAGVIRGTEQPVLSGRDGTITLATTLAISEAAKTGNPVRVSDLMAPQEHVRNRREANHNV
ncbi:MAG: Gfo/Idh/MocA family protein [Hyphomicrobiaceae bacterium]